MTELVFESQVTNLSKSQISAFANAAVQAVLDNGNIMEVAEHLAKMEYFIKEVKTRPEYTDYLREEIAKYGKAATLPTGTKLELAETNVRYEYSQCNDPILFQLENQLTEIEEQIVSRKNMLKALRPEGMEIAIDDEKIQIYPPSKTSTSSVKTTLTK